MSQDDETVERVARAIYEGRYASQGGVWAYVETKDVWHDMARAALSALPERDLLREALSALDAIQSDAAHVIDFYNRNGPTWTGKDGHEYDDMSSVLGRAEIVIQQTSAAADKIRAALGGEKQT